MEFFSSVAVNHTVLAVSADTHEEYKVLHGGLHSPHPLLSKHIHIPDHRTMESWW